MNNKTVRNISEQDMTIPEVGFVKSGETIAVPDDFNNPNFEDVKTAPKTESKVETPAHSKSEQKRINTLKNN